MTKPHEQEWTELSQGQIQVGDAVIIKVMVAPWWVGGAWDDAERSARDVGRAILAYPAMARALLDLHAAISAGVLNVDDAPEFIERVLKEAGVMP